jgi:hypothetical protein
VTFRLLSALMVAGAIAPPLAAQVRVHVVDQNGSPISAVRMCLGAVSLWEPPPRTLTVSLN